MVVTNQELADKIVYLKENNFIPNLDNETSDVQLSIHSFYNCEKTYSRDTNKLKASDFWFRLTFCNYQVSDKFVKDVNREYKRFQILNICKENNDQEFKIRFMTEKSVTIFDI